MKTKILAVSFLFVSVIFFGFKFGNTAISSSNPKEISIKADYIKNAKSFTVSATAQPANPPSVVGCKKSQKVCFVKDDGCIDINWPIANSEDVIIERVHGDFYLDRDEDGVEYWNRR